MRSIPAVALIPLALLIFGFSATSEVVVAAYASVWTVILTTAGAVAEVDSRLSDVGRMLRLGRMMTLWKLIVPAALPAIWVGLRLSVVIALIVAVSTEIIGVPEGVGYQAVHQSESLHPAESFAYIATICILGYALVVLMATLHRRLFAWHSSAGPK
jgi:NitT/TauT family transport system permease protein